MSFIFTYSRRLSKKSQNEFSKRLNAIPSKDNVLSIDQNKISEMVDNNSVYIENASNDDQNAYGWFPCFKSTDRDTSKLMDPKRFNKKVKQFDANKSVDYRNMSSKQDDKDQIDTNK